MIQALLLLALSQSLSPSLQIPCQAGVWTLDSSSSAMYCAPTRKVATGQCSPSKLAAAAKAHLDLEHPVLDEWIGSRTAFSTTLAYHPPCRDYASEAQCRVFESEKALASAKAALDAEVNRQKILNELRAEVDKCEPLK
jgi:hypothetical protein